MTDVALWFTRTSFLCTGNDLSRTESSDSVCYRRLYHPSDTTLNRLRGAQSDRTFGVPVKTLLGKKPGGAKPMSSLTDREPVQQPLREQVHSPPGVSPPRAGKTDVRSKRCRDTVESPHRQKQRTSRRRRDEPPGSAGSFGGDPGGRDDMRRATCGSRVSLWMGWRSRSCHPSS